MNFEDRVVGHAGRVKLTAVEGQNNVYDVSREEGTVTKEGTPLNAATFNSAFGEITERLDALETAVAALEEEIANLEGGSSGGNQVIYKLFVPNVYDPRVWIQDCQEIRNLIYGGTVSGITLVNEENISFYINVGDSGNGIVVMCGDSVGGSSESGSYYETPFIVLPSNINVTDITSGSNEIPSSIKQTILSNLNVIFSNCGEIVM